MESKKLNLEAWLSQKFATLDFKTRKNLVGVLRAAGFRNEFDQVDEVKQEQVVKAWLKSWFDKNQYVAQERLGSVVGPDDLCPRCQSPMLTVKLSPTSGEKVKHCSNPRCRVTAHIG